MVVVVVGRSMLEEPFAWWTCFSNFSGKVNISLILNCRRTQPRDGCFLAVDAVGKALIVLQSLQVLCPHDSLTGQRKPSCVKPKKDHHTRLLQPLSFSLEFLGIDTRQ